MCAGILTVVGQQQTQNRYQLTAAETGLLGKISPSLASKLAFDTQQQAYVFNANYVPPTDATGINPGDYTATLPSDPTKGVSLTDPTTKISVTLKPRFASLAGKQQAGRVIYPINQAGATMVYSVKGNGLKEDIIVPKDAGDHLRFSYTLALPTGVEARMLGRSIGIYSGAPNLYGNVSTGTDKDKALLNKARERSAKTNLIMVIPAPSITGNGKAQARFQLTGSNLTVDVTNLAQASYPLSIDPSLALASTNDWNDGSFDTNNIDLSVAGQASRAGVTGGSVGAFGTPGNNSENETDFIYNGYAYNVGNCFVSYEPLGSDGASFTPSTGAASTNNPCYTWGIDSNSWGLYNGYFYAVGGVDRNPSPCGGPLQPSCTFSADDQVWYAKINSNGTVGTWAQTSTLVKHHQTGGVATYNGYIYAYDEYNSTNSLTDNGTTQYAKIRADGSLGTWQTTSSISSPVSIAGSSVEAYNGYLYVLAGVDTTNNSATNTVYYAQINADGSIGTWQTTSSMVTGVGNFGATAYRGYMYAVGGCTAYNNGTCSNDSTNSRSVQYAPIYANGALGTWRTTNSLNSTTNRLTGKIIGHNNYLYVTGGQYCSGAGGSCSTETSYADLQYAQIDSAGALTSFASATGPSTAVWEASTVVYGGYIYVIGGCTNAGGNSSSRIGDCGSTTGVVSTVQKGTIATDGSLTWTTTNSLPVALFATTAVVYNGTIYVMGGCTNSLGGCTSGDTAAVYYGNINASSGAVTWGTSSHSMLQARNQAQSAVSDGYIYVIAGYHGSGTVNETEVATLPTNGGDLTTAWTTTNSPTGINRVKAVGYGGRIYLSSIGSTLYIATINTSNGALTWSSQSQSVTAYDGNMMIYKGYMYIQQVSTGVYKAPINGDGSVGTFVQMNSLTSARWDAGMVIYNDNIYAIAGCTSFDNTSTQCSGDTASAESAAINNGGNGNAPAAWHAVTGLPGSRGFGSGAVANGYLYFVGGCSATDCGTAKPEIFYAKINVDGTLAPWTTTSTTSLPAARGQGAAVVVGNYLYYIGGTNSGMQNSVYYTQLDPSTGALSSWTNNAAVYLPVATRGLSAVENNGYIYVVGGITNGGLTDATYYTSVGINGGAPSNPGCGSVWCSTTSLPTAAGEFFATAVAYNGNIYVSGGSTVASGSSYTNATYYAPLSANGIGTWQMASTNFYDTRYEQTSFAANGYLYIVGGTDASSCSAGVQFAPFLPSGDLGDWQAAPAPSTGRNGAALGYYNGYAYFMGGQPCAAPVSTVNELNFQAQPRVAHFSRQFTTDKNTMPVNFFTTGSLQSNSTNYTVTYMTATSAAPTTWSSQTVTMCTTDTKYPVNISGDGVSYYWVFLTIDDSQSATFGPETPTTLNDFQLNYHPNPSLRLRGGSTFNGTLLQSLDAP